MTVPTVIRLTPDDVPRFLRVRRRMLEVAPWAFSATPESDKGLGADVMAASLAGEESAVFAVEGEGDGSAPPELVATAGIVRASPEKFAHRARVWGVFVEPEQRGRGLGRAVTAAAVDLARTWEGVDFVDLAVSERSPAGRSLYEVLGFEAWGREPEVTVHAGRRWDEIHMTLRL